MALPIPSHLLPHGTAFPWQGGLVWMHILEDCLLAGGSLLAALALLLFVLKKKDLLFSWLFYLFSFFFLMVGLTRILGMWEIFHPVEAWDLAIKLPLGILSLAVAVVFFIFLPKVTALPSRVELEKANKELQKEMTERQRAEKILKVHSQKIIDHQHALLKLAQCDFADLNRALETITETDAKVLTVERVSVWFFNEDHSEIVCEDLFYCSRQMHEKGLRLRASDYPCYFQSLEESRTVAANNAQTDPRTCEFTENYLKPLRISSMMDVPIRLRGKMIGVLCHEHTGPLRSWSPEEQEFAAAITDQVSLALEASERRKSEEKYRNLVETSNDLIWALDTEGKYTFVNREAALKIYGYEPQEMIGRPFTDFQTPEQGRKDIGLFQKLKEGESPAQGETTAFRKDGSLIRLIYNGRVFTDKEGNFLGAMGTATDITSRKMAEEKARRAQEEFISLVNNIEGIIWEADPTTCQFTFINEQAERLLGYPVERWLQEPNFWRDHIYEEDRDWVMEYCQTAAQEKRDHEFDYRMITADGRTLWLRNMVTVYASEGQPIRVRGVMYDITKRKQARAALELQRKEQKTIFDSVPAMIYYKDTHNRLLRVNKLGAAAVGRTVEEMEGHFTKEFYPLEAEKFYRDDLEVIQSGKPKLGIVEDYRLSSGEVRWVQSDKIPYRDEQGAVIGVIVFVVDITERKKAEEELKQANLDLQQLSRMKTQFASMVSHELRTPLTVIKEGIGIVLDGIDGPVTEAQRETLDLARDNVDRLGRLINSVLDYEKLESGKMEMNFEETELGELLRHVHQFMKRAAEKRYIQLSVQVPVKPLKAVCDADKLKEVVINLIDNGMKFTPKGGKIVVRLGSEGLDEVKIEVEDNGIGIKKEDQAKIFEMFSQAAGDRKLKIGGSGVGLAVCKLIVDQHHGNISVKSALGKGTTFRVCLPTKPPPNHALLNGRI